MRAGFRRANHPLDQVDSGDFLGDAVLHLQAGVHFQEIEFVALVVVNEFHGPGISIADRFAEPYGGGQQTSARFGRQAGSGCLFDHLLIAPLRGAIALAERHHATVAIAEDLHFDVAGVGDELLQVQTAGAKAGLAQAFVRQHTIPPDRPPTRTSACRCHRRPRCSSASRDSRWRPLPGWRRPPNPAGRCRAAAGTPFSAAISRAVCFSPKARIWSGVGPMKTMPAAAQASANSAFSLRKP